jgi:hypothetical protein
MMRWLAVFTTAAALTLATGCGDETQAPAEDHTPVSFTVLIDGTETAAPFSLTEGQTVRVQLKFANAAGEDLDEVEATHFAGLTFTPSSLATATRLADHHFQFDVTGGAPGTGTVQVSYGHDELADEHSFTPAAVTTEASPPGGELTVAH